MQVSQISRAITLTRSLAKYNPVVPKGHAHNQVGILPASQKDRVNPNDIPGERRFNYQNGKFVAKPGNATIEVDQVTHTGQYLDENDLRNVRWTGKGMNKLVNPNWAIDLVNNIPPIANKGPVAMCDGSRDPVTGEPTPGPMGHPQVFINLDKGEVGTCLYCGLRYYNEDYHDIWAEEYPAMPGLEDQEKL